ALNVLSGDRYGKVSDETIGYALGRFGKRAVEVMDPEVRSKILDRPRAVELAAQPQTPPSLDDLSRKYGGVTDLEELALLVCSGGVPSNRLSVPAGPGTLHDWGSPVAELVGGLLDNRVFRSI